MLYQITLTRNVICHVVAVTLIVTTSAVPPAMQDNKLIIFKIINLNVKERLEYAESELKKTAAKNRRPPISIVCRREFAENPLIFSSYFCQLHAQNVSGRVVDAYNLNWPVLKIKSVPANSDPFNAFIVESIITRADASPVAYGNPEDSLSPRRMPSTEELKKDPERPIIKIANNSTINIPFDIFGYMSRSDRQKPDVYKVQVTVHFADATSGHSTVLKLDPFQVAVTQGHIDEKIKFDALIRQHWEKEILGK